MYTAYCLHTSEGVPVRRIMETKINDDGLMLITSTECDWDWNRKAKVTTFVMPVPQTRLFQTGDGVLNYHKSFRLRMSAEHDWRFEIYWPQSSLC